ncbi:MAG: phosphoribosylglycinamide formyltransferase [Pseudomonadota bacterium]
MTPPGPRLGILISGRGSNMLALLDAIAGGGVPATPAVVFSNDPAAPGLALASRRDVPVAAIDHRAYRGDRSAYDAAVARVLAVHDVDLVACAGYMRIMTDAFVEAWRGRMLNIHPSLLPLFKGLKTHARALEAGVAVHGCTVHEVVPEVDGGRILGQAAVPVIAGDTAEGLAARVLRQEHRLYAAALAAFVADAAAARRHPIALLDPTP